MYLPVRIDYDVVANFEHIHRCADIHDDTWKFVSKRNTILFDRKFALISNMEFILFFRTD